MTLNTIILALIILLLLAAGAEAADFAIVKHGKSAYQIVVPTNLSPELSYAAQELQQLLLDISSVKLPIVPETRSVSGPAFLLGHAKKVSIGLVNKAKRLGEDGVLIKTIGKNIVLLGGGDRGQLYSVYVLMERFLGCRFLANDCTIIPKKDILTLPDIDYSYAPPFIYRETLYNDAARWSFAARQRLNGSNMAQCLYIPVSATGEKIKGILIQPFVHSAAALIPADKYFASHPEYFGLVKGQRHAAVIGGQLCFTNPDVLKISIDQVMKWLDATPNVMSVDVSQNDAYPGSSGACECENCQAVVKEEGAQHGPILRFVNAIADAVAKKYPGKYVDTLAYDYTVATPRVTKPRDNVVIRLCHYACYFHGIEGETLGTEYRQAIDDWRKVAKNLFVWHYGTNFWHYLAPNPNLEALAKDIKFYNSHGVNGLMLQGNIQSPGGELAEFRQYLASQLMWDPTLDPMKIRQDFCEGYYGPASKDALEFLASMDSFGRSIKQHIPMNGWNPPDVTTPEFVSASMATLNRAFSNAKTEVYRNRIEKLLLPFWYVQLSWPDKYGVSKEECRAITARVKSVMKVNNITTISEGPPNATDFITRMEAAYGTSN